jgi:hypothetical protein
MDSKNSISDDSICSEQPIAKEIDGAKQDEVFALRPLL